MFLILLLHLAVTVICLLAGFLFYTFIAKRSGWNYDKPIVVYLISGLCILSFFCQLWILFFPAKYLLPFVLLPALLVGGYAVRNEISESWRAFHHKFRNIHWLFLATLLSVWAIIIIMSAGPVIMDDTESYHMQNIKWIREYGTVPGLANLHERYGFNSAWLSAIALFMPFNSVHNFYSFMNGLLSLWFCGYLLRLFWNSAAAGTQRDALPCPAGLLLVLVFGIICWPLLRGNASNANYDFITTLILTVLFFEVTKNKRYDNLKDGQLLEFLIWPVFLFTVRITNFPVLILSGYAVLKLIKRPNLQLFIPLFLMCFFTIIAFLFRNVILTGYLFYPVTQIDVFSFDWKADPAAARKIAAFIKYFNRIPSLPPEETMKLSGLSWLPGWFLGLPLYDKVIIPLSVAGYSWLAVSRLMRNIYRHAFLIYLVLLLQLLTWMLVAPDPRFAYGPLLAGCYFFASAINRKVSLFRSDWVRTVACSALIACLFTYGAIKLYKHDEYRNIFLPVLTPVPPVHSVRAGNIELYTPEKILGNWNARCYGTTLPCLYQIKPGLQARGKEIKDGFKIQQ